MSDIQIFKNSNDSSSELVILHSNQPVTTSLKVAESFDKQHKNVLQSIQSLIEETNGLKNQPVKMFEESSYCDKKGESRPMYLMNRDGFTLLAMGFTGEKALKFKLDYIAAFNAMEERLKTVKSPEPATDAFKDMRSLATAIQEEFIGVQRSIAISQAIDIAEKVHNVPLQSLKSLLPPAEHDTGYLNPTIIGQKLGGIPAQIVNKLLAQKGFQYKDGKNWRLTELGKNYGEEMPYTRNNHSGYQIRWNEKVLKVLSV